jgi:hypothetical protein
VTKPVLGFKVTVGLTVIVVAGVLALPLGTVIYVTEDAFAPTDNVSLDIP